MTPVGILATLGKVKNKVQKISIALPRELTAFLRSVVADGSYSSTSEIVREALRSWKTDHERQTIVTQELRKRWQEGIGSGPGPIGTFAAIAREARRRRGKVKLKGQRAAA